MKKATLQAAGTAVLGIAAVTAVAGPAAADPLGGLPQTSSLTGTTSSLTAPNGGLHNLTSTTQGVINGAAPMVQNATSSLPVPTRAVQSVVPQQRDGGLPAVGNLGSLPALGQLQGGTGHALDSLHQNLPLNPPSIS
ncbi:hypothetical protein [Streptacidiphilus anmyonensis]|uniref:hypothetical protein n=1 Tax=Streptacidiphilus anmyonensis TaxID=405782 RepID=UPI000694EA5D|nr:hypothetical protein [Streptacidiphilus anmyonensis]